MLFLCFFLIFSSGCSQTSYYNTDNDLLDTHVYDVRSTSAQKKTVLQSTTKVVPKNNIDNNYSSTYLGNNLIAEQDILSIDVYKNTDLTTTVQVNDRGYIQFPLLNKVYAKGLTPTQLSQKIKQGLEKDYIVKAFVNVLIKSSNKDKFTIEGSVNKAGVYPVNGKTTLLQAIAHAGGLSSDADEHHATLLRKSPNGQIVKDTIDIAAVKRGQLEDFLLMRGDRIVIQKSIYNRVTVSGAVAKPSIFPLEEGMTVLQSIALAGGFSPLAYKDHVVLLRRQADQSFKKYSVNIKNIRSGYIDDPEIQADDRIVVLESSQRVLLNEVTRILMPLSAIRNIAR